MLDKLECYFDCALRCAFLPHSFSQLSSNGTVTSARRPTLRRFRRAFLEHRAVKCVCDRLVAHDWSELPTSGYHRPLASELLVASCATCRHQHRPNPSDCSHDCREQILSAEVAVELNQ